MGRAEGTGRRAGKERKRDRRPLPPLTKPSRLGEGLLLRPICRHPDLSPSAYPARLRADWELTLPAG